MSREAFHLLLQRYLDGKCTEDEKRIVEELYGMLDKQELDEIDHREINTIEQKLWDRIQVDISNDKTADVPVVKINRNNRLTLRVVAAIAAVFVGAVMLTGYIFFKTESRQPQFLASATDQTIHLVKEWRNESQFPMSFKFEDGSSVLLQPNSMVRYPVHFAASLREVSLEGEGFFQISKDASRPFLVYNKDVITKVLGTSFTVKTNTGSGATEVAVRTGRVMVFPVETNLATIKGYVDAKKQVVLTPNQKTVFHSTKEVFTTTIVDDPEPLILKNGQHVKENFSFNDAEIPEVIQRFEKAYGIVFTVKDKSLYDNTFTGDLSEQTLFNKLDFLCQSIGASYEISGTRIIIKTK